MTNPMSGTKLTYPVIHVTREEFGELLMGRRIYLRNAFTDNDLTLCFPWAAKGEATRMTADLTGPYFKLALPMDRIVADSK